MSARESGFYWVRREDGDPEVACWQTRLDSGLVEAKQPGWWLFAGVEEWKVDSREILVLSRRLAFPPSFSSDWRPVSERPPPEDPVLVWYRGKPAVGRHHPGFPAHGVHEWMVFPMGGNPVGPYPQYYPRWWMPLPEPPEGEATEVQDFGPPGEFGESVVRWRGSVSDLYTDLFPLLSPEQIGELGAMLLGKPGGIVDRLGLHDRLISNASFGKASGADSGQRTADSPEARKFGSSDAKESAVPSYLEPGTERREPQPVPMLLHCPMCSERHLDRGEFATKPHHTHACQICGHVWRPAIVPTVGVHFLPGFKNEERTPQ